MPSCTRCSPSRTTRGLLQLRPVAALPTVPARKANQICSVLAGRLRKRSARAQNERNARRPSGSLVGEVDDELAVFHFELDGGEPASVAQRPSRLEIEL